MIEFVSFVISLYFLFSIIDKYNIRILDKKFNTSTKLYIFLLLLPMLIYSFFIVLTFVLLKYLEVL